MSSAAADNITDWHSGPEKASNHYEQSAKECEAYCLADSKCCAWCDHWPAATSNWATAARAGTDTCAAAPLRTGRTARRGQAPRTPPMGSKECGRRRVWWLPPGRRRRSPSDAASRANCPEGSRQESDTGRASRRAPRIGRTHTGRSSVRPRPRRRMAARRSVASAWRRTLAPITCIPRSTRFASTFASYRSIRLLPNHGHEFYTNGYSFEMFVISEIPRVSV